MSSLKDYIKGKRETLSKSSIITYSSILKNLYKKVFGLENEKDIDFKKFDETDKIIKFLKDMPPNKRKTILSSLVIITDKKAYRDLMLEDVKDYNKEIQKQEKTPEQKESWVNTSQVNEIYASLKENADLLYKKKKLNINDLQEIQSYIIIALLGGFHISPRRSKDFVDFKIKNITDNDNFLDGKNLVFNSYKTSKTYGCQTIPIDNILLKIIKKWISVNPTDYLLFDAHFNPLSSVKLNQRLNKIFGNKKVGVNQLRHTYLTNKFGHTINQKNEVKETMADMGSSAGMLDTYVKK